MPKCNVVVKITAKGKIDAAIAKMQSIAKTKQIEMKGDSKGGTLLGHGVKLHGDKGTYKVAGQVITITITNKPWAAMDAHVKAGITKLFNGV